jgi:hypothetical protein
MAAFMPKSYLYSQSPPDIPVKDWLTWSVLELELSITNASNKIAGLIGINKARDLQYIFMPIIAPKAMRNNDTVVLGNSTDVISEPALVYLDMSDLGFTSVIETFTEILEDIHPKEHLLSNFVKSITWETAKVPLGLACKPNHCANLLWCACCQSFHLRSNFDDKLGSLSAKPFQWAKLIKENLNQQENDDKDYDKILSRISCGNEDSILKYVTPVTFYVELLDTPSIHMFPLLKDKWKDKQAML